MVGGCVAGWWVRRWMAWWMSGWVVGVIYSGGLFGHAVLCDVIACNTVLDALARGGQFKTAQRVWMVIYAYMFLFTSFLLSSMTLDQ